MLPFVERRENMLAGFSNYVFVIEYCLGGLAHNRPGRAMSNQVYDWSQSDEWNLEHLLEDVTTPTGRLITFGDIQRELGDEAYQVIVTVFEHAQGFNAGLKPAYLAMSVSGMTLDDPRRLVMIDQLSAAGYGADGSQPWPVEWVKQIKAMAVTIEPRWRTLGLGQAPTRQSIANARVDHSIEVHTQKARIAGIRFGEHFLPGQNAGEVMSQIWESM
jgi:hypothetical protein